MSSDLASRLTAQTKKKRTGQNDPVRKKASAFSNQKTKLIANCTCRGELESPARKRLLKTTPSDVLPICPVRHGWPGIASA